MKSLYRLLLVLASASFFYAPAQAQNTGTVTSRAFAIGKGAGTTGFASVLCTQAQIAIGQSAANPICAALSGDVTMTAAGVTAIGANKVTNSMLATMANSTTKCRTTAGTGNAEDCTAAQMRTIIDPQLGDFTAANTGPAAQTIKLALQTLPVRCEDFSATCGSADDTTAIQAAIDYAATTGRCFQFTRTFIVTTILVADRSHLCLTGKGGLFGKTGTTASAVLEIRNTIGTTIDGNITLNCNSQTGYTSGLKVWSNGLATAQFNPRISLSAVANCKLAAQYGDTVQPDNTFSENFLTIGYTYNCAQGVKVIGIQAVLAITNSVLVLDPTNWPGVTNYGLISVGSAIQMTGGEIVNAAASTGAAVRMEALTSLAYTNSYGNVHITGALIETYAGASIANPAGVTSPQFGAFYCSNCYGAVLNDVGNYIDAADDFIGKISVTSSRFSGTLSRANFNIKANSASIYFDLESFGTNMLQGYAGVSGGAQYMVSKDVKPGVVVTGTSATQAKADSIVTFNGSGTYTYTMLSPAVYPGRELYLNNATSFAVNSASSNILGPNGTASSSILPAGTGQWVVLVSDTSQGNYWRVVASGNSTITGTGSDVRQTSPTLITPILGVATATSINGVTLDTNAWSTYTPTVTAQSGTITTYTATGRYKQIGKTILCTVDVQVTTAGTAGGAAVVTLPVSSASGNYIGASYEYGLTGKGGSSIVLPAVHGAGNALLRDAAGVTYFANGAKFSGTVIYELP